MLTTARARHGQPCEAVCLANIRFRYTGKTVRVYGPITGYTHTNVVKPEFSYVRFKANSREPLPAMPYVLSNNRVLSGDTTALRALL